MIERLKALLWTIRYWPQYAYAYHRTLHSRQELQIYISEDTIRQIVAHRYSVSRFGDGELQMMDHYRKGKAQTDFHVDTFQGYSTELGSRLWEVFHSVSEQHLNCLPYQFKDASISTLRTQMFWQREWLGQRKNLLSHIVQRQFGDTNFTRFYMGRKDIKNYPRYIKLMQSIWNNRDILLVEGAGSRAGVGNDLFSNSKSLKRIIGPTRDAFSVYHEILNSIRNHADTSSLILICLGHTATVLAYDLSLLGYQAIDLGHIDIEYEWYKMGAKKKVAIPNRYVNEVLDGRTVSEMRDDTYTSQIVATIKIPEL